jgi:DNA modification methylase
MSKTATPPVIAGNFLANQDDQRYALAICDSPYNQGMEYEGYDDAKPEDEFYAWCQAWMTRTVQMLTPQGSLFVFAPDPWVSEIDIFAKRALHLHKRNHIVWAFTFGQAAQRNFTRSHCHILYYTRRKTAFTYNADTVRVPSARQLVYKDKRATDGGKQPDNTWMLLHDQLAPHMRGDRSVWLESRICGTFKERRKHSPNQLPEAIIERLVKVASNRGDRVLDPFAGTGTVGKVCKRLGRLYRGYEVCPETAASANKAIAATQVVRTK